MDGVDSYVTVSLFIVGFVGMLVVLRNWRQSVVSNRRLFRMMLACGIDEATAREPQRHLDFDVHEAKRRCRRCPAPKTCDRWLNGETVPGNDFCPNSARFKAAAETAECRITYDRARRPGRRLDT